MGQEAPSGPGPPHYQEFTISLRHTTLGRNPLDERSARRRDLYLKTRNTHNRQTTMSPAGFVPAILASEPPQTQALDRAATEKIINLLHNIFYSEEIFIPYGMTFEMWCWRRMEKSSWTDHVRKEEVLLRANEQRNILQEIRKRKATWIGHILRRNCLLKQVMEGKTKGETEVTRRRGRRRMKLLDDFKDRKGYSHLKEEALDRTMWRNRFGGGFGPVVRQNTE